MNSPAAQLLKLVAQLINQFATPLALSVGLYWAWVLVRRWRDDTDPSIRKFSSSAFGSVSFIASGAYKSVLLAGFVVFVTWPAAIETPILGALILGGIAFHAALEKNEDMEAPS